LPATEVPRVVVLDHAGLHASEVVEAPRKVSARPRTFL
jgi:hypothetical protein